MFTRGHHFLHFLEVTSSGYLQIWRKTHRAECPDLVVKETGTDSAVVWVYSCILRLTEALVLRTVVASWGVPMLCLRAGCLWLLQQTDFSSFKSSFPGFLRLPSPTWAIHKLGWSQGRYSSCCCCKCTGTRPF